MIDNFFKNFNFQQFNSILLNSGKAYGLHAADWPANVSSTYVPFNSAVLLCSNSIAWRSVAAALAKKLSCITAGPFNEFSICAFCWANNIRFLGGRPRLKKLTLTNQANCKSNYSLKVVLSMLWPLQLVLIVRHSQLCLRTNPIDGLPFCRRKLRLKRKFVDGNPIARKLLLLLQSCCWTVAVHRRTAVRCCFKR